MNDLKQSACHVEQLDERPLVPRDHASTLLVRGREEGVVHWVTRGEGG